MGSQATGTRNVSISRACPDGGGGSLQPKERDTSSTSFFRRSVSNASISRRRPGPAFPLLRKMVGLRGSNRTSSGVKDYETSTFVSKDLARLKAEFFVPSFVVNGPRPSCHRPTTSSLDARGFSRMDTSTRVDPLDSKRACNLSGNFRASHVRTRSRMWHERSANVLGHRSETESDASASVTGGHESQCHRVSKECTQLHGETTWTVLFCPNRRNSPPMVSHGRAWWALEVLGDGPKSAST